MRSPSTLLVVLLIVSGCGEERPAIDPARVEENQEASRVAVAEAEVRAISHAVESHIMDQMALPADLASLAGAEASYIDEVPTVDPWGHPYELIVLDGLEVEVRSLGADGAVGGEGEDADVSSRR